MTDLKKTTQENSDLQSQVEKLRKEAAACRMQSEREKTEAFNLRIQLDVLIQESLPMKESIESLKTQVNELTYQLQHRDTQIASSKVLFPSSSS